MFLLLTPIVKAPFQSLCPLSLGIRDKLWRLKTDLDHSGLGSSVPVTDMFRSVRAIEMKISNLGRKHVLVG